MKEASNITSAIPHKFPFVMLDRIMDVVPESSAIAIKRVSADAFFTPASYYPQIFMLEAMAQLAAIAAARHNTGSEKPEAGFLAAVTGAKFHNRPKTGDNIIYSVEFEAAAMGLARFKGKAVVDHELAAEATLTFSVPGRVVS